MQRYQQTLILVYSTSAAKWRGANDVKVASFARRLKIRHFSEKRTCVAGLCQMFCGLDRAVYGVAATNQLLRAGQRWRKELSAVQNLHIGFGLDQESFIWPQSSGIYDLYRLLTRAEGEMYLLYYYVMNVQRRGGTGEREPQSQVSTMVSSLRGSVKFKLTDTLLA